MSAAAAGHARMTRMPVSAERIPSWPLASIVFLCCLSSLADPIVLTVLSGTFLLAAAVVVIGANQRIELRLGHVLVPFGLILCAGLASGVGAERYAYFKDAWYVSNPAMVMLTGYVLYKLRPDLVSGLRAFLLAGLLMALWQARGYFFDPGLVLLPAVAIRERIGTGLYPPVLALVILAVVAGRWHEELRLSRAWGMGLLLVVGLAVVGVFSRTALMVAMVALAARAGCFARQEWLRLVAPAFVLLMVVLLLESMFGRAGGLDLNSFFGKLVRGLREIAFTDTYSMKEINTNFRGFESAQALKQVIAGTPLQILFGQGFGATVDLGVFIPLGGFEGGMPISVRRISVLHNGYMYLLVKGGVVSLALYLYVLGYLYIRGRRWAGVAPTDPRRVTGRLLQAVAVTLAVTTYVIGGVFNKNDMFAFLLCTGFLLAALDSSHDQPA